MLSLTKNSLHAEDMALQGFFIGIISCYPTVVQYCGSKLFKYILSTKSVKENGRIKVFASSDILETGDYSGERQEVHRAEQRTVQVRLCIGHTFEHIRVHSGDEFFG